MKERMEYELGLLRRVIHCENEALISNLLAQLGGLEGVVFSTKQELEWIVGKQSPIISCLEGVRELGDYLWGGRKKIPPTRVRNSSDSYTVFADLGGSPVEKVAVAALTNRNEVIRMSVVFQGGVSSAAVKPREILREVMRVNGSKMVVAHNHPSQCSEPSEEDIMFTSHLEWAASLIGIGLEDHLIVCRGGNFFSFADAKLIGPLKKNRKNRHDLL